MTTNSFETKRSHYLVELLTVVTLLLVFLSMMSAREAVDGGAARKLFLIGRMALLVVLCTWFLRRNGETWARLGLRRPRRWWAVPLLAVGGFLAVVVLSSAFYSVILPALGIPPPQLASAQTTPGDVPAYLFAILVAWSSAAFGEELLLRGFILDRTAKVIGSQGTPTLLLAIVVQAALFGSFHFYQGVAGVIVTGSVGLVMGLLWLVGGKNLWACILLHGTINFISATEAFTRT